MSNIWRSVLCSISLFLLSAIGQAATFYVSPTGDDANDGSSWAAAKKTIQAAVDLTENGDCVFVTNGLYYVGGRPTPGYSLANRLVITNAITVRSVNGPQYTSIAGAGPYGSSAVRCVYLTGGGEISGFTMTNGCTYGNDADAQNTDGGGVFIHTSGIVSNCVLSGNYALSGGGVISYLGGTVQNCLITGNESVGGGGVRFSDAPNALVENCTITENRAVANYGFIGVGGGVHIYHTGILRNCLVANNCAAGQGGGVYIDWGSRGAYVESCTVAGNTAPTDGGFANVIDGAYVNNSIIFGNANGNWSGGAYSYCCIQPAAAGTGNISSDPLFVDAASGNYRLQYGSPCINAGINSDWMDSAVDLDNNPRILYGTVDMGCYEWQEPAPAFYVSPFGNDANDGSSWALAKQTIQAAVDIAGSGDTVWVMNGTYSAGGRPASGFAITNRLVVTNGATVRSVNGPGVTTIVGAGPMGYSAVRGVYLCNSQLIGFSVTNGASGPRMEQVGGGILLKGDSLVSNCVISGNSAEEGGGIAVHSESGAVVNSLIMDNHATLTGGGVLLQWDSGRSYVSRCRILGNVSDGTGGGVSFYHRGSIYNSLIEGNTAGRAGGVWVDWSGYNGPDITIANCTVVNNSADENGGVDYVINGGSYQNCIIQGNSNGNWSGGTYSYCSTIPLATGSGNITAAPQFADTNYHLQGTSPCIDTGNNEYAPGLEDLDGKMRIVNGIVDMGCYEYCGNVQPWVEGDYDGDRASDLAVFDPAGGNWYVRSMQRDTLLWQSQWGWSTAMVVPGDYDGDGRGDQALFDRVGGYWYINSPTNGLITWATPWGWSTATPVAGDYDGDRRSDLAVFDTAGGYWYIWSLSGYCIAWGTLWGWETAIPVRGDYDGDAKSDLAVFDAVGGYWYIWSMSGYCMAWHSLWGWEKALPVPGDYDGDGTADLAVYDAAGGYWYIWSLAGNCITWGTEWGWNTAVPVSGDFDGDGRYDLALFDPATGLWYIRSLNGNVIAWMDHWGWPGATPVGGAR